MHYEGLHSGRYLREYLNDLVVQSNNIVEILQLLLLLLLLLLRIVVEKFGWTIICIVVVVIIVIARVGSRGIGSAILGTASTVAGTIEIGFIVPVVVITIIQVEVEIHLAAKDFGQSGHD